MRPQHGSVRQEAADGFGRDPAVPDRGVRLALPRLRWLAGDDWRAREARLNSYPRYVTEIDGQPVHFLHMRCGDGDAVPLILTHGWPGSIVEYLFHRARSASTGPG